MIRDGDLKLTYWTHDNPELYNLRSDPEEMTNLALRSEHRKTIDTLKQKLFAWHRPQEMS
jgi:choline-sulfatase